jgi:hypothetical protein
VSGLDTPWQRWSGDSRDLQHLAEEALTRTFVTYFERTITHDRTISIESVDYEVPREAGRGGAKILVTHRLLEGNYYVVSSDRLVRLHPVDLPANARSPRLRPGPAPEDDATKIPEKTAADLAFERDLGPVVDADGGSLPPTHADEEETS